MKWRAIPRHAAGVGSFPAPLVRRLPLGGLQAVPLAGRRRFPGSLLMARQEFSITGRVRQGVLSSGPGGARRSNLSCGAWPGTFSDRPGPGGPGPVLPRPAPPPGSRGRPARPSRPLPRPSPAGSGRTRPPPRRKARPPWARARPWRQAPNRLRRASPARCPSRSFSAFRPSRSRTMRTSPGVSPSRRARSRARRLPRPVSQSVRAWRSSSSR